MKRSSDRAESAGFPYLDTIETSHSDDFTAKSLIHKGSDRFSDKEKYEEKSDDNNSCAIKSAEYYKKLTDELAGLLIYEDSILQERAEKMIDCGTFLEMYDGSILSANFCRQRICPNCQRRRALRTCVDTKKMQEYLKQYRLKYLHLVLTVPNCTADDLCDTIDKLYKASSAFFKLDAVKKKFKGVMRCLEVTYNAKYRIDNADGENVGKCFHPHLHCLVAVSASYGSGKNYLSHAAITGFWMACNDYGVFLDAHISAVKGDDDAAIAEIAKYCVKPLDLCCPAHERVEVLEVLYSALHGRRLIQMYGVFREAARAVKFDDEAFTDDLRQLDETKIQRYTYNRKNRSYERW